MKVFELSGFWKAAGKLLSLRFMIALLLMLLCLETVARMCPHIIPKDVHQRFFYSSRKCRIDCTNKDKTLVWIANERGARGGFYMGQPLRIAVLGTSTSIDTLLDQSESWPQQLESRLGRKIVHVDNYARGGAGYYEAKRILDHFLKIGRRYDIILVMTHTPGEGDSEKYAFHYWGNWSLSPGLLKFPNLLRNRIKKQVQKEPRLNYIDRYIHDRLLKNPLSSTKPGRSEARRLRQSGKIKFIDMEPDFPPEEQVEYRNFTKKVLEAARRVADKTYFLVQPVAYAPDEHPDITKRWYALKRIKGRQEYRSNKSVAMNIRRKNDVMKKVAFDMRVPVIDLDAHIMPELHYRYDLFDDKWHFAPAGAEIAAEFVASVLRADNPQYDFKSAETK